MYKITKLEFKNHDVFGNRTFDFTDDNGNPFDTIVIAGLNGVGKTLLLNEINSFYYRPNYSMFSYFNSSSFNIPEGDTVKTLSLKFDNAISFGSNSNPNESKFVDYVDLYQILKSDGNHQFYAKFYYEKKFVNIDSKFNFYSVYSKVNINYNSSGRVTSIGNRKLDEGLDDRNLSINYENPENLISLFLDIYSQDAIDFMEINNNNEKVEHISRRIDRFINAFKFIFGENLIFKNVEENVRIKFEKNNKTFDIYNLSSGEKQIVYRGIYLLRNKESTNGAVILIDEPEISMHPEWEERIYNYYKQIFTVNNLQTSQLFFVTHSEHVLKSAFEDNNSLILKLDESSCYKYYNGNGSTILPYITMSEIKYAIFDIYSIDFHVLLFSYIQNHFGYARITDVDNYFVGNGAEAKQYINSRSGTIYNSLPVYIRNTIDHPESGYTYSEDELKKSIEYMIQIILNLS